MPAAKKLFEADGDVKVLKKAELFALLSAVGTEGINAQSGLAATLVPAYERTVAKAARGTEAGWRVICAVFWQPGLQPVLQLPAPAVEGAGGPVEPIVLTDPQAHVSPADKGK